MPKWDPRLNKVLGVEEFVTRHTKATTGDTWLMETDENRAMSVYLHFLANGPMLSWPFRLAQPLPNHWIRGPVRSLPDLAHEPFGNLGHSPAFPVVPG